jgi:hypothetical protein
MTPSSPPSDPFPRALLLAVTQAIPSALEPVCGGTPARSGVAAPDAADVQIAAGIPFTGSPPWDLSLLFPGATAGALALAFAGFEIPLDSPDMNDAVGELVNVLAGHVIERLEAAGHKSKMTLPAVTRADAIVLHPPGVANEIFLVYDIPQGRFWVRLTVPSGLGAEAGPA